jgi:hypothetical protein
MLRRNILSKSKTADFTFPNRKITLANGIVYRGKNTTNFFTVANRTGRIINHEK